MPDELKRPDPFEAAKNHMAALLAGDLERAWCDGSMATLDALDLAFAHMAPGSFVLLEALRDTISDMRAAAKGHGEAIGDMRPATDGNAGGSAP